MRVAVIGTEAEAVVWIALALLDLRATSGIGMLDGVVVASIAKTRDLASRICLWVWVGTAWLEERGKRFTLAGRLRASRCVVVGVVREAWCSAV
jgi:hypothetical protein